MRKYGNKVEKSVSFNFALHKTASGGNHINQIYNAEFEKSRFVSKYR